MLEMMMIMNPFVKLFLLARASGHDIAFSCLAD
jgi:hypothetical protein